MSTDALMATVQKVGPGREQAACWHCALPVPDDLIDASVEAQFCCNGCRTAYAIIHDCGLEQYYALRRDMDRSSDPAKASGSDYKEMDDPAFRRRYVRECDDGRCSTRLYLQGVHCAACVWLVERLPVMLEGVVSARLSLTQATLEVHWMPDVVSLSGIAGILDQIGYPPYPVTNEARAAAIRRDDRKRLSRLAVAGACAGNNMLVAFALYAGVFSGMSMEQEALFRWVSAVLGLVSLAWPGSEFFRGAWIALRRRAASLDLPLSLGLGAGGIAGIINTIVGKGDIYFDSLSVLVFFLLVGRWVQYRQQRLAADQVAMLRSVTPRRATRVREGALQTIAIESIQIQDRLLVRVGEIIPADGTIVEGRSTVDEAILTGESMGRSVQIGCSVLAGSTNQSSPIEIAVTAIGTETRIGIIMQAVEDASLVRAPIVELANRISGVFVAVVGTLAAVTSVIWFSASSPDWLEHTIALLVVSCPCSLGLATPLAIAVAQGRAARRSILVKEGEAIERLAHPNRIWLDKTGTLTEGRMEVRYWHGPSPALGLAASLERYAVHPIAQALVGAAKQQGLPFAPVREFRQVIGLGAAAIVEDREVLVGCPEFLRQSGVEGLEGLGRQLQEVCDLGLTSVVVSVDGQVTAIAGIGDQLRPDAAQSVSDLVRRGWSVGILSGDHPSIVRMVARQVAIPETLAFGGLFPEDKLRLIRESGDKGTVVMVGDGVNDSAALAAATVGVAVKGGAEASLQAAPVYLAGGGLNSLVELVDGARRTMFVVYGNFTIALLYNTVAISLAMAGWVNPLMAAILMPTSSLCVVGWSIAAPTFRSIP